MQIIIEIPEAEIPRQQAIIEIPLHFVHGGKICEAGGYGFEVLPKGHGRLIDADKELAGLKEMKVVGEADKQSVRFAILEFESAKTIIEADKAESEE